MRLPPVTPEGVLKELRSKPDITRRIAFWWTILGIGVPLFAITFAVAHFFFGQPILNRDTGQYMTDGEILQFTAIFVVGGLFFVMGAGVLRRLIN